MYFLVYLIIIKIFLINCLHLTNYQINTIISLIRNNKISFEQRSTLNNILYKSYEKMAISKAIHFKNFNRFKCKNMNKDELILSGKIGLFKAIKNYNGKSNFTNYANIYIKGELLKILTDHYSLSILPKSIRKKNKNNFSIDEINRYKHLLNTPEVMAFSRECHTQFINFSDNYKFDKYYCVKKDTILDKIINDDKIKELWNKINELDPSIKRIIHLKYDYQFNKIRSNKEISILMCCSEENIRKKIKEIKL